LVLRRLPRWSSVLSSADAFCFWKGTKDYIRTTLSKEQVGAHPSVDAKLLAGSTRNGRSGPASYQVRLRSVNSDHAACYYSITSIRYHFVRYFLPHACARIVTMASPGSLSQPHNSPHRLGISLQDRWSSEQR
jgi:hypothetical protein